MAKYILLSFDNDKDAEEFVQAMQKQDTSGRPFIPEGVAVRGVWKKPTQFCDCALRGRNTKGRAWTRGKKFGWWVCTVCHKPSQAWAKGDAWYTALGTNLLPKSEGAPEWRGTNQDDERGKDRPVGRHLGPTQ